MLPYFFFGVLMFCLLLLSVGNLLSMKLALDSEKQSPFECGFTPKFSARLPFSLRFFSIALIFLVFDVELILIFPAVPAFCDTLTLFSIFILLSIIFILIAGLYHEIFEGSLAWAN